MSTNEQQGDDEDDIQNDAQEPEVKEGEERIPAGFHNVRGIEGSAQTGKAATGTEQISVDVEFVDLEVDAAFGHKPRALTFFYFSDAAQADSVKKLKAMGWDMSDTLGGIGKNVVRASVKYEVYNGTRRMKVDIYGGPGKFEMKNQMDETEKKGFFARLREVDKRQASGAAPPAAGSSPKGYPPDWDKKGPPAAKPATGTPRVDL